MNNFDKIKPLQDKIVSLLLDIKDIKPNLYQEYTLIFDYSINGFIDLGAEYIKSNPQEFEIFLKKLNDIIKILTFIKTKENIKETKYSKIKRSTLKKFIKEEIRKTLREDYAEKLYKIEGLLVTDTNKKTQTQTFSDIRSITGITTMDTNEYVPNIPKPGYKYDRVTIKVDPYPYIKTGKFDIDTIKQIITNVNNIKGVVKFVVEDPQLINIGI
jgi:hypothetical protein